MDWILVVGGFSGLITSFSWYVLLGKKSGLAALVLGLLLGVLILNELQLTHLPIRQILMATCSYCVGWGFVWLGIRAA